MKKDPQMVEYMEMKRDHRQKSVIDLEAIDLLEKKDRIFRKKKNLNMDAQYQKIMEINQRYFETNLAVKDDFTT